MVSPVFRPWLAASIHTPSSSAPLSSICKLLYKITNSCTTAIFDLEKHCSNPLSLPDGLAGCDWNICRCRFDPLIEHLSIVHLSIELIETFADANSTHWHLHPWGEGGLGRGCLSYMKSRCSMRRKGNGIRDACCFADMSGMGFSQVPLLTWSGSGNLTRWDCDWMDLWMLVC